MFCEKCGSEIKEGTKFCSSCGEAVKSGSSENESNVNTNAATNTATTSSTIANDVKKSIDEVLDKAAPIGKQLDAKEVDIAGKKISMLELITIVASLANIIACFLPLVTVEVWGLKESAKWIDGDGKAMIVLVIITFVLMIMNKYVFAIIPAGINLFATVYTFFSGAGMKKDYGDIAEIHMGIGMYIALIASIAIFVVTILNYAAKKNSTK